MQVLETCIYADDLDQAEFFYGNLLGLELVAKDEGRHLFYRCGRSMVLIFNPKVTRIPSGDIEVPPHGTIGSGHIAFAIKAVEIKKWKRYLGENNIELEREIIWPEGGHSLYFRDPANNCLELATPKLWHLSERDVLK